MAPRIRKQLGAFVSATPTERVDVQVIIRINHEHAALHHDGVSAFRDAATYVYRAHIFTACFLIPGVFHS